MYQLYRKKITKFSSCIVMYIGVRIDQITPQLIVHNCSDYIEKHKGNYPDPSSSFKNVHAGKFFYRSARSTIKSKEKYQLP